MNQTRLLKSCVTRNEAETMQLAGEIAKGKFANKSLFLCLQGDLGAGKTIFVKGFAREMGIDEKIVKSPTYTYMRIYKGINGSINHFDYYRLDSPDEDIIHQLNELKDRNEIVLIEWPEKIEQYLPGSRLEIKFELTDNDNERIISIYEVKND